MKSIQIKRYGNSDVVEINNKKILMLYFQHYLIYTRAILMIGNIQNICTIPAITKIVEMLQLKPP